MARLLTDSDYLRTIQTDNLAQVTEGIQQVKLDAEQVAQTEMISYLAQRYKVNDIFTNTTNWSNSVIYKAKQLVVDAGNFFYVTVPEVEYNALTTYVIGDKVFYENSVYTCLVSNVGIYPTNSGFWGTGVPYSITGIATTDTTKWSAGDNRNPLIVQYLLDCTLYNLHSRINPRNIPDLRKERYNGNDPMDRGGAIGWLKKVASGDLTADLPQIDPQQGVSIRWGNANGITTRNSNTY